MTGVGMSIVEFLLARIAEDEAVACQSSNPFAEDEFDVALWDDLQRAEDRYNIQPHGRDCGWKLGEGMQGDCTCMWPARVLAECEAKRRIVNSLHEALGYATDGDLSGKAAAVAYYDALQAIAVPYADHLDYRPAWR